MTQTIGQQIKWDFKVNNELIIRDKNGKRIYREGSSGFWEKWEWDSKRKLIYWENLVGTIIDNRPKPCEDKEIVIGGEKFKLVKL